MLEKTFSSMKYYTHMLGIKNTRFVNIYIHFFVNIGVTSITVKLKHARFVLLFKLLRIKTHMMNYIIIVHL